MYGSCLALQFDMTEVEWGATSDNPQECAITCDTALDELLDIFKLETFTGYVWNWAEASDRLSIFSVKTIEQFTTCNYMNFLQQLNNRFSDWAFLGGWATNILTQLTVDWVNGTQTSAVYLAWNDLVTAFGEGDYTGCGKEMMLFLVSTIDF